MTDLPPEEWLAQTKKAVEMMEKAQNQMEAGLTKLMRVHVAMFKMFMGKPPEPPEEPKP